FEDAAYSMTETKLHPKDLVMLFTDGLYEVQDPKGELYTQAMLIERVQVRFQIPAPQLFDDILAEIRHFAAGTGFTDDVCLVGMELVQFSTDGQVVGQNA